VADYKDTLNLPQTEFPMRANCQREPEMVSRWRAMGLYERLRETGAGAPGHPSRRPPTPTRHPHRPCGQQVLKDIIVKDPHAGRARRPFVPGWDCHGLPIELQVEKQVASLASGSTPRVPARVP